MITNRSNLILLINNNFLGLKSLLDCLYFDNPHIADRSTAGLRSFSTSFPRVSLKISNQAKFRLTRLNFDYIRCQFETVTWKSRNLYEKTQSSVRIDMIKRVSAWSSRISTNKVKNTEVDLCTNQTTKNDDAGTYIRNTDYTKCGLYDVRRKIYGVQRYELAVVMQVHLVIRFKVMCHVYIIV